MISLKTWANPTVTDITPGRFSVSANCPPISQLPAAFLVMRPDFSWATPAEPLAIFQRNKHVIFESYALPNAYPLVISYIPIEAMAHSK